MASPFDLFTGQPAIDAAGKNRSTLLGAQGTIGNLADITNQYNSGAIRQGYGGARQDLSTGYDASTGAINTGAGAAQGYLDQGQSGAMGSLAQARGDLTANGGAYAPLSALAARAGRGSALYSDALGINGAEGTDRARGAYTPSLGYETTLNSGIDAINRRANAAGMLVGGNANRDAITFAHDLSNRDMGSWLDRLRGMSDQELSATSGAAAGNQANNTTLANLGVTGAGLQNAGGVARAGVATGQGQNIADIAQRYYGGQAGLDTGEAGALTNSMNNTGNWMVNGQLGLAPQIGKTFQDEAQASLTGQKNLFNLGMQGATALAGGGFGMPGGNLGLGSMGDASMWNSSLPKNGFSWG
jgi:hypothetical protein